MFAAHQSNTMKKTHHNDPIQHKAGSVIHEAIATKAYELWVRDGKPDNQSDAFWLAAEQELYTGRINPRPSAALLPVSF